MELLLIFGDGISLQRVIPDYSVQRKIKQLFRSIEIKAFQLYLLACQRNNFGPQHLCAGLMETQKSAGDWDHDEDGFHTPTRRPGGNDDFGS
jgi:hypothetical protein